jgi:hypothetical protein
MNILTSVEIVKIITSKIYGKINTVTYMEGDCTFYVHIHHQIKGLKILYQTASGITSDLDNHYMQK